MPSGYCPVEESIEKDGEINPREENDNESNERGSVS
jgi:hypothetical protein